MTKYFVPYLTEEEMLLDLNSSPPIQQERVQQEAIHEKKAGK
jgi:hypothetical protein